MKAVVYRAPGKVEVAEVPKPRIEKPTDAIVRVTAASICGSDLHLYHGKTAAVEGLIFGHEFVGVVEELGSPSDGPQVGDRVMVDPGIRCGVCDLCKSGFPFCPVGAVFGTSTPFGGTLNGGQAEYVRVPFGAHFMTKMPPNLSDADAILLLDNLNTGYCGVQWGELKPGEVVAVFGCGAVGLCAILSAKLFNPSRIYAVDTLDYRLAVAEKLGAIPINPTREDPAQRVWTDTFFQGADVVVEASGNKASLESAFQTVKLSGRVSIVGVFEEEATIPMTKFSIGGISIRAGLTPADARPRLLNLLQNGLLDTGFLFTHALPLSDAARAYEMLDRKEDGVIKVLIRP